MKISVKYIFLIKKIYRKIVDFKGTSAVHRRSLNSRNSSEIYWNIDFHGSFRFPTLKPRFDSAAGFKLATK